MVRCRETLTTSCEPSFLKLHSTTLPTGPVSFPASSIRLKPVTVSPAVALQISKSIFRNNALCVCVCVLCVFMCA
jgi:hypothetical protein